MDEKKTHETNWKMFTLRHTDMLRRLTNCRLLLLLSFIHRHCCPPDLLTKVAWGDSCAFHALCKGSLRLHTVH